MAGRTGTLSGDRRDEVVPLGVEPPPQPPPRRGPAGLHGLATAGMALFALCGTFSMLAFVTVNWGPAGRLLVVAFVLSVVGFVCCASLAVFSAARRTHARPDPPPGPE